MKDILDIPQDRKPARIGRLCLLLGLTAVLVFVASGNFADAAEDIWTLVAF